MEETPQELYADVVSRSTFLNTNTRGLKKDGYDARLETIELLAYLYHFAYGMKLNQIAKFSSFPHVGLTRERFKNLKRQVMFKTGEEVDAHVQGKGLVGIKKRRR